MLRNQTWKKVEFAFATIIENLEFGLSHLGKKVLVLQIFNALRANLDFLFCLILLVYKEFFLLHVLNPFEIQCWEIKQGQILEFAFATIKKNNFLNYIYV